MAGFSQFRSRIWDPTLIISQIISVQSLYYVCLGLLMLILDYISGDTISVRQIFDDKELQFSSSGGKITLVAFVLNSFVCSFLLWFVVQRAKQCLDFAFTTHFIHFVCCCIVIGFPKSWVWWLTNIACVTLTAVISEYLCMRYELRAIPVSSSTS